MASMLEGGWDLCRLWANWASESSSEMLGRQTVVTSNWKRKLMADGQVEQGYNGSALVVVHGRKVQESGQ